MIRAEITNYESIEHAVLEIDGFTTVQGPNQSGKSAAMRAINAALTNQPGTAFISWGKSFCEVRITAEGFDLLWHKEEGNNYYVVNGKRFDKIGKDEPPAEIGALGYGSVNINGQRHSLHYAEQFNSLFLVDEQGSTKVADLVASVYGLDRLYKASELCSRDQKSREALLRVRRKDLEEMDGDLKKFEGLDDVVSAGEGLKAAAQGIDTKSSAVHRARGWHASVNSLAVDCNRLKPSLSVPVPSGEGLQEGLQRASKARHLLGDAESMAGDVRRLQASIEASVPDSEALAEGVERYRSLCGILGRLEQTQADESRLSPCVPVQVLGAEALEGLSGGISRLNFLKSSVEGILSAKGDLERVSAEVSECGRDLSSVEEEMSGFKVCPLCGAERK